MSRYDLIIFDCDGTLVDSELAYNECTLDIFAEYGLPHYTIEYALRNWMGKAQEDIIASESIKNKITLPMAEIISKFISKVPSYQEKYLKPIEGALEAVRALSQKFKCCIASNGERANVIHSLELLQFSDFFDETVIFTKDNVARAKPFPDLFLFAAERMGSTPEKTMVIEDSISGIQAGHAAHMFTIGFNGVGDLGRQSEIRLRQEGADIVFSRWQDILYYINS